MGNYILEHTYRKKNGREHSVKIKEARIQREVEKIASVRSVLMVLEMEWRNLLCGGCVVQKIYSIGCFEIFLIQVFIQHVNIFLWR